MAPDHRSLAVWRRYLRGVAVLLALAGGLGAASAAAIYSCVDSTGKRLTSDRPIPECAAREQRVLNADGSTKQLLPPTMTADERAAAEARHREKEARRAAEVDAVRRDRNLRTRYPNEAAHQKARLAALDDLKRTLQLSQQRLDALGAEKKPLVEEAEFYVGRAMPTRLKQQLDGIDAAAEAQRALMQNQQAETLRINAGFDAELARLRKLWAGAAPGSLGPTQPVPRSAAAEPPKLNPASASTAR